MESAHPRRRDGLASGTLALTMLLVCAAGATALDPALDISQYAHTAWSFRDGFSKGRVTTIVQTPDGYLWLGTEFGLLRFDGVRSVPWQPPGEARLPSNWIRTLLAASDGTLWIGTQKGLASWKDGTLTQYPDLAGAIVVSVVVDREGTVWASAFGSLTGMLCEIHGRRARCDGTGSGFGTWVGALHEDRGGRLWAVAQTGLWRWRPGPPTRHSLPDAVIGPAQTLEDSEQGALLIATQQGITQFVDGHGKAYPLPGAGPVFHPRKLLRDRDGGLWIGTVDRGLLHVHQGRTDVFTKANGLSGNSVTRLFEDREGNIWVATMDGIDRFRDLAVRTISASQGLSSGSPWSILTDRDDSVWLGALGGLSRLRDGRATIYHKPGALGSAGDNIGSLFEDYRGRIWVSTLSGVTYFDKDRLVPVSGLPRGHTSPIVGDAAGHLWMSNEAEGLFHLFDGKVVERIAWATLGLKHEATALLVDPARGGVWLGFDGGIAHFNNGHILASYAVGGDAAGSRVNDLRWDRAGALWVPTEHGLSHVMNERVVTLASANGLPCDTVHWIVEDDADSFWLYMACGLARIAATELNAAVHNPKHRLQVAVFDSSDGVGLRARAAIHNPQVAKSADGRLWFLPNDGVSVFDPRRFSINPLPPPVHIELITADGKVYDPSADVHLPPLIRELAIDYTALSFVAPEKNRFRVKLEGWDSDWRDAGNRRQAIYSNLAPGQYRFRVVGANNSGVWNETGAVLDFAVAPAYYQTRWFQATVVATFLGLLLTLHQLRVRQLAREFNSALDARVSERTRIARELHDTLLQSFHGLLLRFQAATNALPEGPVKERFAGAIDQGALALAEGRDAVQGLRTSAAEVNDLAAAISALGQDLAAVAPAEPSAAFEVAVEGTPRHLQPILRDEVYRIAGEALRNAQRHAQARQIEVEIRYDAHQLRVRVRDNGKGMAPQTPVEPGGSGHFGVPGMYERAAIVGGRLEIWSEINSGTEVDLTIPAMIAYATSSTGRRSWSSWLSGHEN